MECNKDEAVRAKEIAEKKFSAKDIVGARKFALKAQNLYPMLEGISQMIATLDVYVSAENKVSGEADWYRILGVSPRADDEAVRKQYRKLALILHPDKNKSVGADGAFKLISEAWSLLSDKARRLAYDQKRNAKVFQKVSTPAGGSSAAPPNGFYNFTKSSVKTQKSTRTGHSSNPISSHKPKRNTFWTVCHQCKMQYEYLRVYLNHKLLCPNCQEAFVAVETAPPTTNGSKSSTPWNFSQQRQNLNHQTASKNTMNPGQSNVAPPNVGVGGFNDPDSYNQTSFQWGPFSRTSSASSAAQAATVVQQAYEKVKREREEAQAATKREDALRRKNYISKRAGGASSSGQSNAAKRRRGMENIGLSNHGNNVINQTGTGYGGAGTSSINGPRRSISETLRVNGITKPCSMRDVSQVDVQTLLMQKAKMEIHNRLNEWKLATVDKSSVKDGVDSEKAKDKSNRSLANPDMGDQRKSGEPLANEAQDTKPSPSISDPKTDAATLETLSINVPDPDFHDFDKDRNERCFGENQVWAVYDDDDGMPRYYAMIHNVISLNPFKMKIGWLNSKTNSELGPLNWIGSGFSKTCGDFRVGRYEIYNSLNSFSHKVRWTKGTRGMIHIYPRKGDVWALYRNWSPDWNELTADEVIHKYDMVEVLEDYSEERGVTVTPLVKVAGFKTVFHQHLDPREVRRIPREEMFRFSHHVPSYLLSGQEGPNAPKGCRELDPAAVPSELLQVILDVKEEEILQNEEKQKQEELAVDEEKLCDEVTGTKCVNTTENKIESHKDNIVEIIEDTSESEDERVEPAAEASS